MNSFVHVYTGNGKGKTTAAFGLSLRAAGAGKQVFFAQFVKGKTYSEIEAVEQWLPAICIKQYGCGCFIVKQPEQADIDAARQGLNEVKTILKSGKYQLVVLDEANIAIFYKLFTVNELLDAINERHPDTEVVVTGRYAPQQLLDTADLVTEMMEVKHYFTEGVEARKGIEF
ncbi:MAG TPA: cob(I)yrinic acid a,c-diamide adenosyltransferase [Prolixibacteraceae bacterium]|nr:cob(I)yrinic acid a,c-diamide adenosyltransferase [Prolixibacteraceae bacterium]